MVENKNLQAQNTELHERYHTISLKISKSQVNSKSAFNKQTIRKVYNLNDLIISGCTSWKRN